MMQIWFLSNGSYSLKNCHNPFGKAIQPPLPPYGKMPVEHLKSLHGSSLRRRDRSDSDDNDDDKDDDHDDGADDDDRDGGKVECMLGDTMEVTAMTRLRDVAGGSSEGSPENFILQRLNVSIAMGSGQIGAQLSGAPIRLERHIMIMVIAWMKRNWRTLLIAVCFGETKRSFGIWFWPERGNLEMITYGLSCLVTAVVRANKEPASS